jgi:ribonuclease III
VAFEEIQKAVGYTFTDTALLERALTHGSFRNENGRPDNRQLAFIGDAVVELACTRMLLERFPDLAAGDLDPRRQGIVNRAALAKVARAAGVGKALLVGHGAESDGARDSVNVLAETFEAVIAAVYIDSKFDFERACGIVRHLIGDSAGDSG